MNLKEAKRILSPLGLTIRSQFDEYRVAFSGVEFIRRNGIRTMGSPEDSAYYTNDLQDAVKTGKSMAEEGSK